MSTHLAPHFSEKVICLFNMNNLKPLSTPLAPYFKSSTTPCVVETDDDLEYMLKIL
jgi:hypothetical protein